MSRDTPAETSGNNEDIFDVEKILDHKIDDGILKLLVRWLGYGAADDTWEPELDLRESANEVVSAYMKKNNCKDGDELFEKLQKKKKQKTPKKRPAESDDDDDESVKSDAESEESFNTKKSSAKKQKRSKKTPSQTPTSSKSSKVPTKAALKSYDSTAPVTPNNAKKAAMEVRDLRRTWFEEESSDDEPEGTPTEVEKIANKVKRNESVKATAVKETVVSEKSNVVVASNATVKTTPAPAPQTSQQGTSSSKKIQVTPKQNGVSNDTIINLPRTLMPPAKPSKKEETTWSVHGIVRHVDEKNGDRTKLILMGNSKTGDQKVLEPADAFALDSWALTKYLLDRCEF